MLVFDKLIAYLQVLTFHMARYIGVLLSFILLSTAIARGQDADSVLMSRIEFGDTEKAYTSFLSKLDRRKIDTIVTYYITCTGAYQPLRLDSCNSTSVKFVFWKARGKSYLTKINGCTAPVSQRVSSILLETVYSRITELKTSKVLYPQFTYIVDGKEQKLDLIRDHSCLYRFEVRTKRGILKKEADDYAIETKYMPGNESELNSKYYQNKRTLLYKVITMAEKLINDAFIRIAQKQPSD